MSDLRLDYLASLSVPQTEGNPVARSSQAHLFSRAGAAENLVLGAEREAGESGFQRAKGRELAGENEQEIGAENLEAGGAEQAAGGGSRERDGVAVEGDAVHDHARAGVPGIVFPEGEEAAGASWRWRRATTPGRSAGGMWWNVPLE